MSIRETGFTLIELMITVAIIGILSSVGYPSYMQHIQKAKRVEAEGALVSMATAMEQWRVENTNDYGDGTATVFATQVPTDGSGTKTYTLSYTTAVSATSTPKYDSYILTATPTGSQSSDICKVLTLDSTGIKGANGISPDTASCWE